MKSFRIGTGRDSDESGAAEPGGAWPDRQLRIFVTGATGYVGSAVASELVRAGHEVTGLTRWAEHTLQLKRAGVRAVVGDIRDPGTFAGIARARDVIVHAAFQPGPAAVESDSAAIKALLRASGAGQPRQRGESGRMVVYTSGIYVLGPTGDSAAGEDSPTDRPAEVVSWLPSHERRVLDSADDVLATAVIRLGTVYGGAGGSIGRFFATAEREGAARFVGDGTNRWSPVHLADIARLYRLVIERRARGVYHGVAGEAVSVAELAGAASRTAGAGGATMPVPLEEARIKLGPLADALAMDQVIAAPRSRALGWEPERPSFLDSASDAYAEWKRANQPA